MAELPNMDEILARGRDRDRHLMRTLGVVMTIGGLGSTLGMLYLSGGQIWLITGGAAAVAGIGLIATSFRR